MPLPTFEQFLSCLNVPYVREQLGLTLTDQQAQLLLDDPEKAGAFYAGWRMGRQALVRTTPPPIQRTQVGSPHVPPSPLPLPQNANPPRPRPGFPFRRPWATDWVFWWAVIIVVLTPVAILFTNGYYKMPPSPVAYAGFFLDAALATALNFAVFVLPVAWVARVVRRRSASR